MSPAAFFEWYNAMKPCILARVVAPSALSAPPALACEEGQGGLSEPFGRSRTALEPDGRSREALVRMHAELLPCEVAYYETFFAEWVSGLVTRLRA